MNHYKQKKTKTTNMKQNKIKTHKTLNNKMRNDTHEYINETNLFKRKKKQ